LHIKTPKTKTIKGIHEEDNNRNEHDHKYKNEMTIRQTMTHKTQATTIKTFTHLEYKYYTRK